MSCQCEKCRYENERKNQQHSNILFSEHDNEKCKNELRGGWPVVLWCILVLILVAGLFWLFFYFVWSPWNRFDDKEEHRYNTKRYIEERLQGASAYIGASPIGGAYTAAGETYTEAGRKARAAGRAVGRALDSIRDSSIKLSTKSGDYIPSSFEKWRYPIYKDR